MTIVTKRIKIVYALNKVMIYAVHYIKGEYYGKVF